MKAITIQGAGIDKTTIEDGRAKPDAPPFVLVGVEGKPFRVTGITFDGTGYPSAGSWGGLMSIRGTCKDFRIDHCRFRNTDHMLTISGDTYGLIDHCHFDGEQSHGGNVQPIDFSGPGGENYREPLSLGSQPSIRELRTAPQVSAAVVSCFLQTSHSERALCNDLRHPASPAALSGLLSGAPGGCPYGLTIRVHLSVRLTREVSAALNEAL